MPKEILQLDPQSAPWPQKPYLAAMGNFDGLHLAHQELFRKTILAAKAKNVGSAAISFHPHPDVFFERADLEDRPLMSVEQRISGMYAHHIQSPLILTFNRHLANRGAQDFLSDLCQISPLKGIICGDDFRLGKNREGGVDSLSEITKQLGLDLEIVPEVSFQSHRISASHIRALLSNEGNVGEAASFLGRPYILKGMIQPDFQNGRKIGFPTLNLAHMIQLVPKTGVYSGYVEIMDPKEKTRPMKAVFNIGYRPTIHKEQLHKSVEAHVLGNIPYDRDLNQQKAAFYLCNRLRDEKKFPSINELRTQIQADVEEAIVSLKNHLFKDDWQKYS